MTAGACGVRAACCSNNSGTVVSGTGRAVSFQSCRSWRRSAGVRTSKVLSGGGGRLGQQPGQPASQRLDSAPVEQIFGVLERGADPGPGTVGVAVLTEE